MDWILGGKKKDSKEKTREVQRGLRQEVRGLDKTMRDLDREEAKLLADMKRAAAGSGDQAQLKILASSVLRCRAQKKRILQSQASLRGVESRVATASSAEKIAAAMGTAGMAMAEVNARVNPAELQQVMQQFEKASMQADAIDGIMDDAILAGDGSDMDEETDALMSQILDGIAVDASHDARGVHAGSSRIPAAPTPSAAAPSSVDAEASDLERRFAALRPG